MAEPASGEESKSDSDATDGELHRTCRICYSAEFQDGMGAFLRPTPCNCAGNPERGPRDVSEEVADDRAAEPAVGGGRRVSCL